MRIAIAQIETTEGAFLENRGKILLYAREAAAQNADLVVFPEMCLEGYPSRDLLLRPDFLEASQDSLQWLARHLPVGLASVVGHVGKSPYPCGQPLQNLASIFLGGEIIFSQAKSLLPNYDIFDEGRYFQPARTRSLFPYMGENIGLLLCEDIWGDAPPHHTGMRYSIDPKDELVGKGASLLIVLSASPFFVGKKAIRRRLLEGIGIPSVYTNAVGTSDGLIFDGSSFASDGMGNMLCQGPPFQEALFFVSPSDATPDSSPLETKEKEIEEALLFGMRGYLKRHAFPRVHLGLSGGIDSAVVAVLATKAVGADRVSTFSLPSRYTSPESREDAHLLAATLGVAHKEIAIASPYEAFRSSLASHLEQVSGLVDENLQARIRGIFLMAYANQLGSSLALVTGNKSEFATGYCTLYGDMCGGLAVIGDLFKSEVYALAHHLNREETIIPLRVLSRPPSAELRFDQKDEDTLPPYELLDELLEAYLIEGASVATLVARGHKIQIVRDVLSLVARAEHKRRQAPPILKVSPCAFGDGRRVPIAQGDWFLREGGHDRR